MTEPEAPRKGECPCGCDLYGNITNGRHVRGCVCKRCMGKRNRSKGLTKQREARKRLGVAPSHKFGDANEENWNDPIFANEVKSGAQIKPAVTAWTRIETQVKGNESDFGSRRKPCRAVLMPDNWGKEGLVMLRLSTWEEIVRPALEQYYDEK
jgi:hypothetical protein